LLILEVKKATTAQQPDGTECIRSEANWPTRINELTSSPTAKSAKVMLLVPFAMRLEAVHLHFPMIWK
jgi:hypothetical protein